jgi:hypothetical protein
MRSIPNLHGIAVHVLQHLNKLVIDDVFLQHIPLDRREVEKTRIVEAIIAEQMDCSILAMTKSATTKGKS